MTMFPGIRRGVWAETLGFDATTLGRNIDRRAISLALTERGREKPLQLLERYSTAHDHPLPKMVRATVPTR